MVGRDVLLTMKNSGAIRMLRACATETAGQKDAEHNRVWRLGTRDGGVDLVAQKLRELRRACYGYTPRHRQGLETEIHTSMHSPTKGPNGTQERRATQACLRTSSLSTEVLFRTMMLPFPMSPDTEKLTPSLSHAMVHVSPITAKSFMIRANSAEGI